MKHKQIARAAAHALAHELLESGVPADDVADAMIVQALAAWAADTNRLDDSTALLAVWTEVRDGR